MRILDKIYARNNYISLCEEFDKVSYASPVKIIVDKIKIEEDTYKMLFFLNEEEYKYTLYLKIVLKVLDFVNDAYQELDYKMKYKLIPQG